MTPEVRTAAEDDIGWLVLHEGDLEAAWVARCVAMGEYLVAYAAAEPVGFLRFSWFWGTLPYMDRIHVIAERRRGGVGTALLAAWEAAMRDRGASLLMTSSMSDEPEPQAWHRRNGFSESGRLTFGRTQPTPEVFFIKDL